MVKLHYADDKKALTLQNAKEKQLEGWFGSTQMDRRLWVTELAWEAAGKTAMAVLLVGGFVFLI